MMNVKGWAMTMGIGAAAGAVAVMMMPRTSPARKLAARTADKVETAACKMTGKLTGKTEL